MVWLVILLGVVGLGLIMSEIFVPGGVLGTLGRAALVACVVIAATHFSPAGVIVTVAGTMTAIFYAFVQRGR